MNVLFSETAWSHYLFWQQNDKRKFERINDLIKNIKRTPFQGIGKPEPLKQELTGFWSRRIDSEHRLVYRVIGKEENKHLEIIACKYHY